MQFQTTEFFLIFLPWFIFLILALVAVKLVKSAKGRAGIAVSFGALVQIFSPDPYVERTIEMMTIERKAPKKQQDESGEPPSIDDFN